MSSIYIYYINGKAIPIVQMSFSTDPAKDYDYVRKMASEFMLPTDKLSVLRWDPIRKQHVDVVTTKEHEFKGSWQNRWGSFLVKIHALFPHLGFDKIVQKIQSNTTDIWECVALRPKIKQIAETSIYDKEVTRLFTEHLLS